MTTDASAAPSLRTWTATTVADDVRAGRLTALDATREALRRIETRDGSLGAFQVVRRDAAVREAAALDTAGTAGLPLAGVPVAIKDNIPVEGEPMRVGSAATEGYPQTASHEVVRRIREAGGVVVGLTRVPELCVFGATDSVYGVTRNPWDPERTPGGSSGGSAAAVASGQVPVAHGNDGMGSVRIPAACTGIVGIKPGGGVVPCDLGETDWYGLSENGALGTTVADTALLLSVLAGDPSLAVLGDVPTLRIAVSTRPPVQGVKVDREHVRALFATAAALMRDGHDVERHDPTYPNSAAVAGLARWFAGTWADAEKLDPALLEPRVRSHAALGKQVVERGMLAEEPRDAWKQKAGELLSTYDVLMTPVLAQPPLEAKRWSETNWATTMAANVRYAPFSAPWNVASFPAMSVPAGVHPTAGTPMSVQLVAAPGKEHLLLDLAARIETLRPWQRTAPGYL
ncbi:amidase [Longivirga aurantiaca]|uniref:Amidase n=1 Tax=Longivirga aurantiaca TaxID=1837743 RepID=A0ABW1SYK3_9ACTN